MSILIRNAAVCVALTLAAMACRGDGGPPQATAAPPRNLVIVTIDTLRADRVGSYGYPAARTPAIDALAARGTRFAHAFAPAPITLPSHASLMTGLYPPGHAARHNGVRVQPSTPTLAASLRSAGFATGAFVAAFPLDRRFGLADGFDTYSDVMPRDATGRPANERPGAVVVDEAIAWLAATRGRRFFLWVHLFEPHAPYTPASDGRPAGARYDDEVATADAQVGRIVEALGADLAATLFVLTADHGEAFGEHGEIGHSIFVYDTTLRVPLVVAGPRIPVRVVSDEVSLVDLAPTIARALEVTALDADGVDLTPAINGEPLPQRDLYAESLAPLLDFGWSPLRALRSGGWKYIEAPREELYRVSADGSEADNLAETELPRVASMKYRLQRYGSLTAAQVDAESRGRLQALGYVGSVADTTAGARPDPKDRVEIAARIAEVTSGELSGAALESALRRILALDPRNPQAHLRLGHLLLDSGTCKEATEHFDAAIASKMPTADAHLGRAACETAARRFDAAASTLRDAERLEPGNPVVAANLGIVLSDGGRPLEAIEPLTRALGADPDLHQARFNLAIAYARAGRRADAAREARELLRRLPAGASQRPEVERLLATLDSPINR